MTSFAPSGVLTAILPCNNLDASERFYNRLGFTRSASHRPPPGEVDSCRLLSNGSGGFLHLTDAVEGWLVPGRNPFGLYLYLDKRGTRLLGDHAQTKKWSGMTIRRKVIPV